MEKIIRIINGNELNLALCEGRHEIPQAIDGYIFGEISNGLLKKPELLERMAFSLVWGHAYKHKFVKYQYNGHTDEDGLAIHNVHINLYVTGLTIALISVLNAMRDEDVTITLWHYDRDTGKYYSHEVV